jgi:ABC-type sugar transport system permease subunit
MGRALNFALPTTYPYSLSLKVDQFMNVHVNRALKREVMASIRGTDRPWRSILVFLIPAVLLYAGFIIYPVGMTFYNSLHKLDMANNLARSFVGMENFRELLTNDLILEDAMRNSITWALVAPFFDVGLGFFFALILFYFKPPLSRFFRTAWFVPILVSWVVTGVLFRWIYNYNWGPLVTAFRAIGLDTLAYNYLGSVVRVDPGSPLRYAPLILLLPVSGFVMVAIRRQKLIYLSLAGFIALIMVATLRYPSGVINVPLYSLIAVTTWKFIGFNMVIFLAAMSSLPEELLDAAKIDGANDFQVLSYVIIPLLQRTIANLFILSWIGKMTQFALVWVTTRGGPIHYTETIATYVQKRAFQWRTLDLGYPSALAVLWFLVVFAGSILFTRLLQGTDVIER